MIDRAVTLCPLLESVLMNFSYDDETNLSLTFAVSELQYKQEQIFFNSSFHHILYMNIWLWVCLVFYTHTHT